MNIRKVGKVAAYAKAPAKTYILMHPIKGTKRAIFLRGLKSYATRANGARLGAILGIPLAIAAVRNLIRR